MTPPKIAVSRRKAEHGQTQDSRHEIDDKEKSRYEPTVSWYKAEDDLVGLATDTCVRRRRTHLAPAMMRIIIVDC